MSADVDVAIIGAGPYALSLAAHLRTASVDFRIFGKPMEFWKSHMPPGMLLKSHAWSSCLYDPESSFTLKRFCGEHQIAYHDSIIPVSRKTFIRYGEDFQAKFVPTVERKLLTRLENVNGTFQAFFDDGTKVAANRVVLAVGVYPFKRMPGELGGLPPGLASHSGDHGDLDRFVGKEVAIIGAGASAIDLAALLHERGVSVSLIARARELSFAIDPARKRSGLRRLARLALPVIRPGSGIGSGWTLKISADAPVLFHQLPARWRMTIVDTTLGPLGHSEMRNRVLGKLPTFLGSRVESAEAIQSKAVLRIVGEGGSRRQLRGDHVIAATGYKVDVSRLEFLEPRILSQIRTINGNPVLSRDYESSVPGLYFVGPATALSFGPVARFVFGAIHPSRTLALRLSRTTRSGPAGSLVDLRWKGTAAQ